MRLPRTIAFLFVAAGVAIACSSSDSATGGSSGGTNTSSGGSKTTDGGSSSGTVSVPCGGAGQGACGGTGCKQASDCASGVCDATSGTCTTAAPVPASATDGKKDGTETDVDCGGDAAPKCADTKTCGLPGDCTSGVCNVTCQAPTNSDKIQNGDETDVDCGGTTTMASPCATGLKCKVHADCASDGCDDTLHCALERSCTQTNGGLTCGTGETGDPAAVHESCCISLPVPGGTTTLDKYKVTAGRMRAFIERTKGDVQDWYTTNKATLSPGAVAQIDPNVMRLPKDLTSTGGANNGDGSDGNPAGAMIQLGGTSIYTDEPSDEQGCYTGNAQSQANGSHTYYTTGVDDEDRGFDQAFLDTLTLNCVPEPLAAAFCAWDGGRLQTYEENSAAFGADDYPWGTSPTVGGFGGDDFHSEGPAQYGATIAPCDETDTTCRHDWMNWSSDYQNPEGGNPNKQWDYAYFISPPGRFPHDKGAGGHMDIGGLMMELTASAGANNAKYGSTVRWSRAGSWEGHQVNYTGWVFPLMTKYGKTGMRCARD